MKEIKYQQKYVRQLVDMTIDLLRLTGHVCHVPGSWHTVLILAGMFLADRRR